MSFIDSKDDRTESEETLIVLALDNLAISGGSQAIRKSASTTFSNVDIVTLLSTVTGINAKTIATTTLYTVPTGKTAIITAVDILVTTATNISAAPTVGVGIAPGEGDIFAQTSLIGLTGSSKIYRGVPMGTFVTGTEGNIIKLGISVGATATTMTITVNLLGYLV